MLSNDSAPTILEVLEQRKSEEPRGGLEECRGIPEEPRGPQIEACPSKYRPPSGPANTIVSTFRGGGELLEGEDQILANRNVGF